MGQEYVNYKEKSFLMSSSIISWVQKFMELFLLQKTHPDWFKEVLDDLNGNFNIPYWKYFFDEEIIKDDKERLDYCLRMVDLTIFKMKSISKRGFFHVIKDDIKNSWCDISNEFSNDEWLDDDDNYKEKYIGSLIKLKKMMEES